MDFMRVVLPLLAVMITAQPAAAQAASFNCAKMEGAVEGLVCANQRLAALDREVVRLYGLAEGGYRTKMRTGELAQSQREWIQGRDTCAKTPDPSVCVIDLSMTRIRELRSDFTDARGEDPKGISSGPVNWVCDGLGATLSVVSAATEPALVQLTWKAEFATLEKAANGPMFRDGGYAFEPKGDAAAFKMPSKPEMTCRIEPTG
jgi:uncharacterized protein